MNFIKAIILITITTALMYFVSVAAAVKIASSCDRTQQFVVVDDVYVCAKEGGK